MAGRRIDEVEKEKRILQVSLLLPRRPRNFILHFIAEKWGLKDRQARNYIRLAKEEWDKYFSRVKRCGKAYYFAKFRYLYDKALNDNDTRLALDITDKEIKLSGLYIERKEEGPPGSFAEWMKKQIEEEKREKKQT